MVLRFEEDEDWVLDTGQGQSTRVSANNGTWWLVALALASGLCLVIGFAGGSSASKRGAEASTVAEAASVANNASNNPISNISASVSPQTCDWERLATQQKPQPKDGFVALGGVRQVRIQVQCGNLFQTWELTQYFQKNVWQNKSAAPVGTAPELPGN
jgi:hypothetical protein